MSESTELARATPDLPALYQEAVQRNSSPEALQKLFELQQMIDARDAKREFFDAMQRFQEQCPQIGKDKATDKYRYASLEKIAAVIQPHLAACGLSYSFDCSFDGALVSVVCKVRHVAGHCESATFTAPIEDVIKTRDGRAVTNKPQMTAMSYTYASRYALRSALGLVICEDDTDCNPPVEPPSQRQGGPVAQPRAERVSKDDLADLHGYWKETMTGLGADTSPEAFRQFIVDNGGPALEPNKTNSWSKDQVTSVGKAVDRLRGEK